MTLPSMPSGMVGREFLRVAGGFGASAAGASPAGGLDVDNAGNLAADGGVTVGGALRLGAGGVNRAWSAWMDAKSGVANNNASGPTGWDLRGERRTETLDFGASGVLIDANFQVLLPPDYDGSALKIEIFWICDSGTSGGVFWQVAGACYAAGGDVSGAWGVLAGVSGAFQGQLTQHIDSVEVAPANAADGNMLYLLLRRNGPHANDTFDGTARVQGLRIGYA